MMIAFQRQRCVNVQRGFTLLEVMVVVVIVGILFSMASLNIFQSTDRQLEEAARRFAALAQLANEEAILNNASYAVGLSKEGYQFFLLDEVGKPQPVPETDQAFRARTLPAFARLNASINGEDVILPSSLNAQTQTAGEAEEKEEDDEMPKIFFLSSGEMTPFEVTIESEEGAMFAVQGEFTGKVKYLGRTEK